MESGAGTGTAVAHHRTLIVVGVVLAAAFAYALWQVWALRWVTDDAFICFRYAQNLNRGLGLVFNAGERVEGYTNFLWTMITAFGMRLGADPVTWTTAIGAVAYFASVGTWIALSWTLYRRDPARPFLPLTALCLLLQHDQHVFATGGLETSWVTCLLTLGFAVLLLADRPSHFTLAGGLLTVAALSRPDALLFLGSAASFALIVPGPRGRNVAMLLVLPVLVYVPYWLWRYTYYGFPFPNTYYAKSANLAYYEQGARYIWLFVKSNYVLGLVPLALLGLVGFVLRGSRASLNRVEARALVLLAAFLVPYLLYVARVGGDFMFARFLIPVAGIAFFTLECALRCVFVRRGLAQAVGLLLALLVLARHDVYADALIVDGVADEQACYPPKWHEQARATGHTLRSLFADRDVRVAFVGRYAMWAYYAEPAVAIEAETGLTDTAISHRPLLSRGRPGHEKPASLEYLQSRRVHFLFRPPIPSHHAFDSVRVVRMAGLEALMLGYDRTLMDALAGDPAVTFVDFPRYLDRFMASEPAPSKAQAGELLAFSRSYYFDHNHDVPRLQALLRLAGDG